MLKKIEFYWNEDREKVDITDEKIYWDGTQFRHKFNCDECNKSLGCRCYETLESALKGVDDGIVCDSCGIDNALNELRVSDIVNIFAYDEERFKQYENFLSKLVTEDEIKTFMTECEIDNIEDEDLMEIIENTGREDELREYVINLLTYDEKWDNWTDSCDGLAEGESCGL